MYESILEIERTSPSDFGDYVCEIMNAKGETRKKITLSRKGNYIIYNKLFHIFKYFFSDQKDLII